MTDHPETLAPYRMPWRRDQLAQVGAALPFLKYVPKNPLFLLGAAVVGVAGVMAWRNREKISATAQPMIADAKAKSAALVADAKTMGAEIVEEAKTRTQEIAAKAPRVRRRAAPKAPPIDLH